MISIYMDINFEIIFFNHIHNQLTLSGLVISLAMRPGGSGEEAVSRKIDIQHELKLFLR